MNRPAWLWLPIALLLATTSCQLSPQIDNLASNSKQLLVTFAHTQKTPWLPGGSGRSYHAGHGWWVPLPLQARIRQLAKAFNLTEQEGWPIDSLGLHCVVFSVSESENLSALLARIEQFPGVEGAQPMHQFTVMNAAGNRNPITYNDPHFALQYGRHSEHVRNLHSHTRGNNIKIAVIDTIADDNHPDLHGQISQQYNYVNGSTQREHHGTAIAGIIAAKANNHKGLVGLAPEAGMILYGACQSRSGGPASCNSFNIAKALEQSIHDQVQVINLSLAGPHDPLLEKLLLKAKSSHSIIIAAVNPNDSDNSFPASMPEVIGVGAGANEQTVHFWQWLTVGEKLSTQPGGGYQFFYGSSMSTASISALAALILSKASAQETEAILTAIINGDCMSLPATQTNAFIQLLQQAVGCNQSTLATHLQPSSAREL